MKMGMKGYWAVPVIVGIALMLGISSVPAFAELPENRCIFVEEVGPFLEAVLCQKTPVVGQHLFFIFNEVLLCHGDVFFVEGNIAKGTFDHGPKGSCNFLVVFIFEVKGKP